MSLNLLNHIYDQVDLQYEMPKVDKPKEWIRDNAVNIANEWIKSFKLK